MVAGVVSEGRPVTVQELYALLGLMRDQGRGASPVVLGGVDHPLRAAVVVELVDTRWSVYGERADGEATEVVLIR
jgi:hypothetical protein